MHSIDRMDIVFKRSLRSIQSRTIAKSHDKAVPANRVLAGFSILRFRQENRRKHTRSGTSSAEPAIGGIASP